MVGIQERLPPNIRVQKTDEDFQIVINLNMSVESRMSLRHIVNDEPLFHDSRTEFPGFPDSESDYLHDDFSPTPIDYIDAIPEHFFWDTLTPSNGRAGWTMISLNVPV
ncbi:hypothetical protein F66182_12281 [Fusarium sp. NRRL 66182]|nr:hypothetical protein F66182_12281 [Fusarium sp. NRRL 66182]